MSGLGRNRGSLQYNKRKYPAQTLTTKLYIESGVRAAELGQSCFGEKNDEDEIVPVDLDLMRIAIPRRVYTQAQLEYIAESVIKIYNNKEIVGGLKRTYAPELLGDFHVKFEPANE